ncbi:hypothetical protein K8942_01435 [Candidatus Peribacteria bacterium]|nr:MAG: hypothetical protein K8942_01435 [Candidatus Peribacteria bacterium]
MTTRLLPLVLSAFVLLSACSDADRAAVEEYLSEGEDIGTELSDAGTQFSTLMNVQANIGSWTEAEKAELQAVATRMKDLAERAEDMNVPSILSDAHPHLVSSIEEMNLAVQGIVDIANDPSKITEKAAEILDEHGTKAEQYGNDYVTKMQSTIAEKYPDMLE